MGEENRDWLTSWKQYEELTAVEQAALSSMTSAIRAYAYMALRNRMIRL